MQSSAGIKPRAVQSIVGFASWQTKLTFAQWQTAGPAWNLAPAGEAETRSVSTGEYMSGHIAMFERVHETVDFYVAEDDRVVAVGSTSWRHWETGKTFDTP